MSLPLFWCNCMFYFRQERNVLSLALSFILYRISLFVLLHISVLILCKCCITSWPSFTVHTDTSLMLLKVVNRFIFLSGQCVASLLESCCFDWIYRWLKSGKSLLHLPWIALWHPGCCGLRHAGLDWYLQPLFIHLESPGLLTEGKLFQISEVQHSS